MQAAMIYLRLLREEQDLSQADVAKIVGVESKQVYRWERGESQPLGGRIIGLTRAVRGRFEDVERLLNGDDVIQEEVARALAEDRIDELRRTTEDDERSRAAAALISALRRSPARFDRWLGYGARLRDELDDTV